MIVLVLILVLLTGGVAEAGIPNTAGWHNLGVNLESACHYISGNWPSGCKIVEAWGNAGFDRRRGRLFFTGGGHDDGRGNELIALNIGTSNAVTDTQTVSRLKDGTSFTNLGTCTQNGSWRSFHSWNAGYVRGKDANGNDSPDNDRYVWSIQGTATFGDMGMDCFLVYNPNTGAHTIVTHHTDLAFWRASGWWGGAFAMDERQGKLIAMSGQSILYWSVLAGWTKPTQTEFWDDFGDGPYMHGVIDPVRKRYYAIGHGKIWWWNISGTGTISRQQVTVSGTCATAVAGMDDGHAPGMDYYPYRDRIVIWRGGTTVYLLDPATHTCTSVTSPGGTGPTLPSNIHLVAGRFRFVAKDNLFVTCNNTADPGTGANDQCYALRLDVKSNDTDYLTRCRWHGVTACESFDNLSDYTNGVKYFNGDGNFDGADLDTSVKVSGTGALRFNLPAGRSASNISGDWRVCLKSPCTIDGNDTTAPGYTTGEHLWITYNIRITPTMVTNLRDYWRGSGGTRTGWKHANIHNGAQGSCGTIELTGTIDTSFADNTQIWYKECSPGIPTDSSGNIGSPYFQQGNNTFSTTTNGFWCDWNVRTADNGNDGVGCFNWQWQNEWLTFVMHLQIGASGAATSKWEGWILRENGTTPLQVQNVKNLTLNHGSNPVGQRTWNQISFTPYMTGLSTSAPVSANMWIDGFTASSEPPPNFAGATSSGTSNPAPAAPTNIRVSALVQ